MPTLLSSAYALSPFAIPVAMTAVLIVAFGARVVARRATAVSAAFLSMTIAVAIWLSAFAAMYSSRDSGVALVWARAGYLGVPFIAPAVYWFTIEILRIERRRRFALVAAWSGAAFFSAVAVTTDRLIASVHEYSWGFYPSYDLRVGTAFLVFFFGYLLASLFEFIRAYPSSHGAEQKRIRALLVAFAISYLGCIDYLPKRGIASYPFGYLAILAFVFVVARTIRKYDLAPLTPSLAAQEIISTMADVLFVCDSEGRIEVANRAAVALLGYTESELVGKRIDDLLAPGGEISSKLARRSLRNVEYPFAAKSGERIELTLSIAPVLHDDVPAGAVIIGRDVRDRKRAERDVLQAVTLLQSTLDSTADGILVIGDSGRIVSYNRRFVEMWRVSAEAMDSGDDREALLCVAGQLASPDEFLSTFESLSTQPEAESFDLLELKDGRRFERYSIGRSVEGGESIRVWSFRDVTARFTAEAALRESEIRYRLLFEQNAAGVCVNRLDGGIVDCNATFASMLGYRRPDLLGRSTSELYANPGRGRRAGSDLLAQRRDAEQRGDRASPRRRQRALGDRESGPGRRHENGVVHATVVDISDRKRAEEQIEFHAYHDVLTHLPNRKLFTDRLRHALTRARRSGKAVAVLFIDVDHFKTVNDTLGHTAGDQLLLEMARRLRECVREDDTVARLGGDEFTVILADLRYPEDAVTVAAEDSRRGSVTDRPLPACPSSPPSPSASPSIPTTVPILNRCCATPTAPCIAPRRRAGTPTSSAPTR